jgi:hypothetical protein
MILAVKLNAVVPSRLSSQQYSLYNCCDIQLLTVAWLLTEERLILLYYAKAARTAKLRAIARSLILCLLLVLRLS